MTTFGLSGYLTTLAGYFLPNVMDKQEVIVKWGGYLTKLQISVYLV